MDAALFKKWIFNENECNFVILKNHFFTIQIYVLIFLLFIFPEISTQNDFFIRLFNTVLLFTFECILLWVFKFETDAERDNVTQKK